MIEQQHMSTMDVRKNAVEAGLYTDIDAALGEMVDQGLLQLGVCSETGDALWIPTALGVKVLGMDPH